MGDMYTSWGPLSRMKHIGKYCGWVFENPLLLRGRVLARNKTTSYLGNANEPLCFDLIFIILAPCDLKVPAIE